MKKSEIAVENFLSGYNCAQAVAAAFCEDFGVSRDDCLKMSECFGGGMGRMREVCGACSGMFMLAGLKYSKAQPKDIQTRGLIYQTVQDMAAEFKQRFGTIICDDLLSGVELTVGAEPTARDSSFYKKRPCADCVRAAAEIAEKLLADN